jgi:hypothetical protein
VLGLDEARRDATPAIIAEELALVPDYPERDESNLFKVPELVLQAYKCIKNRGSTRVWAYIAISHILRL